MQSEKRGSHTTGLCTNSARETASLGGRADARSFVFDDAFAPIAVIGQTLVNRLRTTLPGHAVQVIPEAEIHGGPSPAAWSLSGHPVVKYHDTDVGFLCPLLLPSS